MAKKVETVKREISQRPINLFHVFVGNQPIRTFEDQDLAQHFAIDEKAQLVRRGCDLQLPEFHVRVEEETKTQDVVAVVPV